MRENLIVWLESGMRTCTVREHTGIWCPGCGLQRSVIAMLKGNVVESISLYPALLPIMLMFGFLFLHLVFKFRAGADILKYLFITNIAIISIHYIYLLFF